MVSKTTVKPIRPPDPNVQYWRDYFGYWHKTSRVDAA